MFGHARYLLLASIVSAATFGAAPAFASAADPSAVGQRAVRPIPPGTHKLKFTTIDYGNGGSLVAGFNTIDSNSVSCGTATCTIHFGIMAQAGAQTAAGNEWAICAVVDGNYASPGCPFQGDLPTDSHYQVGASRQNFAVARGTHSVSFQVYVSAAATMGEWEADYDVYAP